MSDQGLNGLLMGKKINNYICSLENRNYNSKYMTEIQKQNGFIITEKNIITAVTNLYQIPYASQENVIVDTDLDDLILSDEDLTNLLKNRLMI